MPNVPFEMLDALNIDLARVLHGEQSFVYHAPVVVGDTLTFKSRVTSVTDKKGGAMTLIVVETQVTNQHGAHVADTSRTIVVRNREAVMSEAATRCRRSANVSFTRRFRRSRGTRWRSIAAPRAITTRYMSISISPARRVFPMCSRTACWSWPISARR